MFMHRLITFACRQRWLVLILLSIITLACLHFIPRLELDVSPKGLLPAGGPEKVFYQEINEQFTSDNITIILLQDKDFFNKEKLLSIKAVIDTLNALPYITHIDSLFSVPYLRLEDDTVKLTPYLEQIPEDPDDIKAIFKKALESPFIAKNLLSEDGQSIAINLHLKSDAELGKESEIASAYIEQTIRQLDDQVDEVFQFGSPWIRTIISALIIGDQKTIIPVTLLVVVVVLILLSRSFTFGFVPLVTSLISVIWLLGFMAFLSIPLSVMTSIVPALMIIVGSTEDVHLIAEFKEGKRLRLPLKEAIRYMAHRKGLAVFLSFSTTYMGFVSVSMNNVEILMNFALIASTGLLLNFIVTILFVPAYLYIFGDMSKSHKTEPVTILFGPVLRLLCFLIHHKKIETIMWLIGIAIIASIGTEKLSVNNNVMAYFKNDTEVSQRSETLSEELSGIETFMIVLDGRIEGTFVKHKYLNEIYKIQKYISDSSNFDSSLSFADYVAVVNSVLNEYESPQLPEDDDMLNEIQAFIKYDFVKNYISEDYSKAIILVRHSISASADLNNAIDKLNRFISDNINENLKINLTGESILSALASDSVATGQAKSLLIMLVMIFIVISVLFVNAKVGLIAIIPNIFPILMLFGVMGFENIPLDTGTAMIAAIAIGICVNDTMHFMVRYNTELETSHDEEIAMTNTVHSEAMPIFTTSIALAAGFSVLTFSSFQPVVYFGALSSLVMIMALITNFLITPILLSSFRLVTLWDVFSVNLKQKLINECKLFKHMSAWQIKKLVFMSDVKEYKAGENIMAAGDKANELYILLEGRAVIQIRKKDGSVEVISTESTGRVFGILAMQKGSRRFTSAYATEDCRVLILGWDGIERIARYYPRISSLFFKNLSHMLGSGLADRLKA